MPNLDLENKFGRLDGAYVAGLDEVGRGPLAGPVVAACAIIPFDLPKKLATDVNDSKALSAKKREALFPYLQEHCLYAIAEASVEEIDRHNILQASLLAMRRAFEKLSQDHARQNMPAIACALVDGNKLPKLPCPSVPVIKGDSISLSIAAASILAKVTRDTYMKKLHQQFPHYGWDCNAGYPTAAHVAALASHGVTPHHRQSFAPVKKIVGL